jgi:hypothetical protein
MLCPESHKPERKNGSIRAFTLPSGQQNGLNKQVLVRSQMALNADQDLRKELTFALAKAVKIARGLRQGLTCETKASLPTR